MGMGEFPRDVIVNVGASRSENEQGCFLCPICMQGCRHAAAKGGYRGYRGYKGPEMDTTPETAERAKSSTSKSPANITTAVCMTPLLPIPPFLLPDAVVGLVTSLVNGEW